MSQHYNSLISELRKTVDDCESQHDLMNVKSKYLGKKGLITIEFEGLRAAQDDEKKELGRLLNDLKNTALEIINEKQNSLINNLSLDNKIDVTLPGKNISIGSRHPVSIVINEITEILSHYGFTQETGLEIEDEFHNFEALNIPSTHPARDMHDTFYVDNNKLLRTHTSSVQIRSMKNSKPPIKIMTPGKVYRCDSDPTHSPMFHQIEGLHIDSNINFCHLKGVLKDFIDEFFGRKTEIRFRPSYFPFTEPSAELDIKFNGRWLEVLGCGMVHPNVLRNVGINSKNYSGYAFGLGIERFAMLKFGIKDLRMFYENDLSFLAQFEGLK